MPRALAVAVFLLLTIDAGLVQTPLRYVDDLLFQPSALKLPLWTYAQIAILVALGGTGRLPRLRAQPMVWALYASIACVAIWTAIGAIRGGDLNQSGFQTFAFLNGLLLAFVLMAAMQTPQHFALLLRAIVAAAVFRSMTAICAYVFIARDLPWDKVPECMTSHDDSVLFVTGIVILVAAALDRETPTARLQAWALVPLIVVAIHVNNRRLAWVSLLGGLATLYATSPPSRAKRRANRAALCAAAVFGLYAAVGWGRTERIFKPLAALDSMSSADDASTRSRDNENDGLIFTYAVNGALGTGFGREYIETDTTLSARVFKQYRYMPHNSLLALLAFTGAAGCAGILMPFPISVFFNVRTCRAARSPAVRVAAVVGVAEVVVCLSQIYGDMGFFSTPTLTILATAIATAGRLSAWTGAWRTGAGPPPGAPKALPQRALG